MIDKDTPTNTPTDLISRQAAIEALGEEPDIALDTEEEWAERDAWARHVRAIESLPSVPKPVENAISKRVIQDSLLKRISDLNAQGATGIARELIQFKKFVDGITPVEPKRPQGEWVPCTEPPKDRRNVFLAHGTNDFKSCCIGHYEQGMGWYEDRNFFAKPIYDCKCWCDIPDLPDMGDNQFDMRGDKERQGKKQ